MAGLTIGEWAFCALASTLALIFANSLVAGSSAGLAPYLGTPYRYSGDSLWYAAAIQRIIESGWPYVSERSGYPFGANMMDFPSGSAPVLVALKFLSGRTGSFPATMNLFFLAGFPLTFTCSFWVMRAFGIAAPLAAAGATAYTFLPYHVMRIDHLLLTWYFVAPLFIYLGYRLAADDHPFALSLSWTTRSLALGAGIVLLGAFSIYYAIFGLIVLLGSAAFGALTHGTWATPLRCGAASLLVALGILLNTAPIIANKLVNGSNREAIVRGPGESETFGLKLVELVLPHSWHRLPALQQLSLKYSQRFPLVNENLTASLGTLGTLGLAIAAYVILAALAGRVMDERLRYLSFTTHLLFVVATVGGLSSLIALLVTDLVRGWNRISVFIGFATVVVLFITLQDLVRRLLPEARQHHASVVLGAALAVFAIFDQTNRICPTCASGPRDAFFADHRFIGRIEAALPRGAAVYQLPYMATPEVANKNQLATYDPYVGFLHSRALKWSFGGMKGRPGDLFFRRLSGEPLAKQLEVIRALGFSGILVDRRGFTDDGRSLEAEIRELLPKAQPLTHESGHASFYPIEATASLVRAGTTVEDIERIAGYTLKAPPPAAGAPATGSPAP